MFWIVLPVLLLYAALCGFMYLRQRELTYFPQFTRVPAAQTDFELKRDGVHLRGWVLHPGQTDALIYFGGNAEAIEQNRDAFAQWFPHHSVYLVAYRGYGASEGTPTEKHLFGDALALYDHVRLLHPQGRIDVIGRSLGSGVASYVASQRAVGRLALITPFDSLADVGQAHYRWIPVSWLAQDRYDSVRHLPAHAGPLLIVRAGRDQVVPPANTARLIASLPRPPQVLDLQGADHDTVSQPPAYADTLQAFFAE